MSLMLLKRNVSGYGLYIALFFPFWRTGIQEVGIPPRVVDFEQGIIISTMYVIYTLKLGAGDIVLVFKKGAKPLYGEQRGMTGDLRRSKKAWLEISEFVYNLK